MGIEKEKIPTQSGKKASKSRLWHGCLILIIPLAIYIIHGLIVLIPNEVNRHKWLTANISNYQMTVNRGDLSPFMGENVMNIKNGEIIQYTYNGKAIYEKDNSTIDANRAFSEITLDYIFDLAKTCSINFPLFSCKYQYDPTYGYPTNVTIDCPIPDACYSNYTVQVKNIP